MAAVLGDVGSYLLGRYSGQLLRKHLEGSLAWHRTEHAFARWGSLAIPLIRFLLISLGPPMNLIAGIERYVFGSFVGLCLLGQAEWVALYSGLGYLFADAWKAVGGGQHYSMVAGRRRRGCRRGLRGIRTLPSLR